MMPEERAQVIINEWCMNELELRRLLLAERIAAAIAAAVQAENEACAKAIEDRHGHNALGIVLAAVIRARTTTEGEE